MKTFTRGTMPITVSMTGYLFELASAIRVPGASFSSSTRQQLSRPWGQSMHTLA